MNLNRSARPACFHRPNTLALKPGIQVSFKDQDGFPWLIGCQITPLDCPVNGVVAALGELSRLIDRDGCVSYHWHIPCGPLRGFALESPKPRSPC